MYNSQAGQDKFVNEILGEKKNGYFVEIGSNDYKMHNNTYFFEKYMDWQGLMVEYDPAFLDNYKIFRGKSTHIINDATKVDYSRLLKEKQFPENIDYLQIDLDVDNRSTLATLELFDKYVFDDYKFATITFETDSYRGNYFNTKELSRAIFLRRGYELVYPDVNITYQNIQLGAFEDWWIHPELVNKTNITKEFNYKCPNNCCVSSAISK